MKRFILALVIVLIGSGLSYASPKAKKKAKVTIKIATLQPRGSMVSKIMKKLADEVREETNNEVGFKFYWGGVQGDEVDAIRKMRLNQLQGGAFTGVGLCKIAPEVRVTQIPYVFRNNEEVSYVRGKLQDTIEKHFEDAGYVVIGWGEAGFVYTFSKVPLTSIEVLRKQKCWVWGDDPLANEVYRALGVTPVPLPFTDVLTSLSTKMIDTAPCTPFAAVAFRWFTRFKYMTEYPVVNVVAALVVRKDIWDKISPENQIKTKKISRRYHNELIRKSREENKKSLEVLKKEGIIVVRDENWKKNRKYLMDASKTAREKLIGTLYSKELLERMLALVEEYRKNHPDSTFTKIQ
jgi:TRAP-type C4-dicarboxylate transport system substrate-binding protein